MQPGLDWILWSWAPSWRVPLDQKLVVVHFLRQLKLLTMYRAVEQYNALPFYSLDPPINDAFSFIRCTEAVF